MSAAGYTFWFCDTIKNKDGTIADVEYEIPLRTGDASFTSKLEDCTLFDRLFEKLKGKLTWEYVLRIQLKLKKDGVLVYYRSSER